MTQTGGTIDVTIHEMLEDGRVRELYKATGGPWGGDKVNEAFIEYLCDILSKEVVDAMKRKCPSEFVAMMHDLEKIKRKISIWYAGNNKTETVRLEFKQCFRDIYKEIMCCEIENAFYNRSNNKIKGAKLENLKLIFPRIVIVEMVKNVAKKIREHTNFLLKQTGNEKTDLILMVGGFSKSKIVIEEIKNHYFDTTVAFPENPEISVVKGAVIFGWNPNMFKSRKSKWTYGIGQRRIFRENIDPERLMVYNDDNVKECHSCFDKLVSVNEEVEIDQIVTRSYIPSFHNQLSATINIYESEKINVSYCDEPGVRKLGVIKVPMADTTGGKERRVNIEVRFGGTEFFVICKDVTTGAVRSAQYDFCLLYTSPSPRDGLLSRMPSSA